MSVSSPTTTTRELSLKKRLWHGDHGSNFEARGLPILGVFGNCSLHQPGPASSMVSSYNLRLDHHSTSWLIDLRG